MIWISGNPAIFFLGEEARGPVQVISVCCGAAHRLSAGLAARSLGATRQPAHVSGNRMKGGFGQGTVRVPFSHLGWMCGDWRR